MVKGELCLYRASFFLFLVIAKKTHSAGCGSESVKTLGTGESKGFGTNKPSHYKVSAC